MASTNTKTIYIRDEYNLIYKEAEQLAKEGNISLSKYITNALEEYNRTQQLRVEGFEDIIISVGEFKSKAEEDHLKKVHFTAKELCFESVNGTSWTIYLTKRKKIFVLIEYKEKGKVNRTYKIYNQPEDVENIPESLQIKLLESLPREPRLEKLDI